MAICRTCGGTFQWGFCDSQWVLLEPIGADAHLDKRYVDEDSIPRADHRDAHDVSLAPVSVTRLERRIPADEPEESDGLDPYDEHDGFRHADDRDDDERGWRHKAAVAFGRARIAESEGCT